MNEELDKIINEDDSIFGEIMRGPTKGSLGRKLLNKKTTGRRESASDKYLRLCKECDFVWEKEFSNKKEKHITRYEEIPKYKKPVKTCPICLGEPNVEERKIY